MRQLADISRQRRSILSSKLEIALMLTHYSPTSIESVGRVCRLKSLLMDYEWAATYKVQGWKGVSDLVFDLHEKVNI